MDPSDQNHFNTLLTSFSQLSTPISKRLAYVNQASPAASCAYNAYSLEGLIRNMSHQEIRDVKSSLENVNFPTDIFIKLPLELSQMVAQYLELSQAIRARRVSRSWRNILTSSQITGCLLRPWQGASTLRIPRGISQNAVSSVKAECITAYRSGAAFDQRTLRQLISKNGPISNNVAYSNGKIAWIDGTTTTMHVLSLEDHGNWLKKERNGEALSQLALSTSMVAVTSLTGDCWITDFAEDLEHQFHLSLENVEKIVAAKKTLGILYRRSSTDDIQVGVTTWTLDDPVPRHFAVNLHRESKEYVKNRDLKIMLDKSGQSVIVFERAAEKAYVVYFTRFSLEGRVQAEGSLELPDMYWYNENSQGSTPTDANGWATVWSYSSYSAYSSYSLSEGGQYKRMLRVQYKLDRDVFRLKEDFFKDSEDLVTSNVFFWNDVAYSELAPDLDYGSLLGIIDFSNKSSLDPAIMGNDAALQLQNWGEYRRGDYLETVLLGDERFLVYACQAGLIVWAFDKNHGMTETDGDFSDKRKQARDHGEGPWARARPGKRRRY